MSDNKIIVVPETPQVRPYVEKYCLGRGLDIGCGLEKIAPHAIGIDYPIQYGIHEDFPTVADIRRPWEEIIPLFKDDTFDFVYSSHLLEDYDNDFLEMALQEWMSVLRPFGYLILFQPIEDLFKAHCEKTGQLYNAHHRQNWKSAEDFENRIPEWMRKAVVTVDKSTEPIGNYSFYIVFRKLNV